MTFNFGQAVCSLVRTDREVVAKILKISDLYCWQINPWIFKEEGKGVLAEGGFSTLQDAQLEVLRRLIQCGVEVNSLSVEKDIRPRQEERGFYQKNNRPRHRTPQFVSTVRESGGARGLF